MRVFVSVLVAVAFIIFSINANAFLGEIPALIQFREVPKELSFSVTNSENVARELKVGVFFPVEHQFAQKPGIVGANSTQKVVIKLFPRKDLVGSEFFGMIRISLGVNSAEKNIKLVFLPQNSCPIGMESTILETENKEKLLIVSRLENKKQEEAKISFEKISGLPNSWQIIPEDIKSIGPFEEKLHRIFLEPAEEFNGSAELAYNCDGFVQTKKLNFSFKPTQQDFLTGVFSLFSFNIEGSLVINVILAAIAAVLLIAFISRLVKKFSAPDMMSQTEETTKPSFEEELPPIIKPLNPRLEEIKKQVLKKRRKR